MCGIAGLFDPAGARDDAALARLCADMAGRLRHRGPDGGGEWTDASAGIGFGHRRLSVVDLTDAGSQPMLSASGRFVLNFNGEIYNHGDLPRTLETGGVRFRGRSDTEVLVEAIGAWGLERALEQANGMFAFALWDRERRELSLARDRFGQKPLYYGWAGQGFIFASELKAFRAVPDALQGLDRDALVLFLRHGYVPDPWSIWHGVRKLPPGHVLKVGSADISARRLSEPQPYWSLRKVAEEQSKRLIIDEAEAEAALDELLRDAVRRCMVADVPLGVFLSGGVDSSSVAAAMCAESSRRVCSFSIGFHDKRHDEAVFAKSVAAHLGTEHTEHYVSDEEARAVIPLLPEIYDEPFADSSQIPTYLVSKLARRSVTVALSGDGGDELFGGYNRYVWGSRVARGFGMLPRALRAAGASALRSLRVETWDALAGMLPGRSRPALAGDKLHKLALVAGAGSPQAAYLQLTSLWHDPGSVAPGGDVPTPISDPRDWPQAKSFTEQMMLLDSETYLPGDILTKVDRASMAVSLEARAPLLDHRLAEFAWRLPLSMRVRNGQGKWLLRKVLGRYVPRSLIERPKMGFAVPLDEWLRGPLRDWAEAHLGEARLREGGLLDPKPIRQAWSEHLSGVRNRQYAIWAVLMFQAWREAWSGR